ncbi:hypothetical protein AMTRI_Chr10g3310 [Amborella trichopoda]
MGGTNWMSPQDDKLLNVMARCAEENLMMNGLFWFDQRRIKNRLRTLMTNYSNIKKLFAESGFGRVEERRMIIVNWAVWRSIA